MTSSPADGEVRLGLALSGGGLRAAFFHIGLLSQLADADLLRRIAVISTVSGGSILGAAYFLKTWQLAAGGQSPPDKAAYRNLVRELEQEFLEATQRNLRMSTFANAHVNARMIRRQVTSTESMAKLLDEYLYAPLAGRNEAVRLKDLVENTESTPDLIINATTLNRGSLFQFRRDGLGEALSAYERDEDATLRWMDYSETSLDPDQRSQLDRITLGQAVAASCSVPGLFDALVLEGLFKDSEGKDIDFSLVDGGVFDNQGLASLLRAGCTHVICSDATDVLRAAHQPSTTLLNVAMRANEILMDRVRGKVLADVAELGPGRALVISASESDGESLFAHDSARICTALANIRTDLDSFCDLEALSLMDYGHRLSALALPRLELWNDTDERPEAGVEDWGFSRIQPLYDDPVSRSRLVRHLEVGSKQFLKVFWLGHPLPWLLILLPLVPPVGLTILLAILLPPLPWWAWAGLGALLLSAFAYAQNARLTAWIDRSRVLRRHRLRLAKALTPLGVSSLLGWLGATASRIHLMVFDRLYLAYGRVRVDDEPRPPKGADL